MSVWGLTGLPEVQPGDDLARLLVDAAVAEGVAIEDGDVVVVTSKVVSKAEGRVVLRESVRAGRAARGMARATGKDPREVQVILDLCRGVVGVIPLGLALRHMGTAPFWGEPGRVREAISKEGTLLMTVMPGGGLATDAGVDCSNVPEPQAGPGTGDRVRAGTPPGWEPAGDRAGHCPPARSRWPGRACTKRATFWITGVSPGQGPRLDVEPRPALDVVLLVEQVARAMRRGAPPAMCFGGQSGLPAQTGCTGTP